MTKFKAKNTKEFAVSLLKWNGENNGREMPWKGEKDPYKIWLSEIILQQTRVEQGREYYEKFVKTFPTIRDLANAEENKVFKMWEGLGYYSRCKNLITTARYISQERNSVFPETYDEIVKLKGIGTYTAAAIVSFAYNLPYAVLDGNVYRILSRVFGIEAAIDTTAGKKYFSDLSMQLLDKKNPGIYNQAIMDLGAVVCKPAGPLCSECPFIKKCVAFNKGLINSFPVKSKKPAIRVRWFYYLVLKYDNKYIVHYRSEKDIWQNLYEFMLIETAGPETIKALLSIAVKKGIIRKNGYEMVSFSKETQQQLSHQKIKGRFIYLDLKVPPPSLPGMKLVSPAGFRKLAFPRFITQQLEPVKA